MDSVRRCSWNSSTTDAVARTHVDLEVGLVRIFTSTNQALEVLLHAVLAGQVTTQVTLIPEALWADLTEKRMRSPAVLVVLVLLKCSHPCELLITPFTFISATNFCWLRRRPSAQPRTTTLQHNWCIRCSDDWQVLDYNIIKNTNSIQTKTIWKSWHTHIMLGPGIEHNPYNKSDLT